MFRTVKGADARRRCVRLGTIWQQKNLVLITLSPDACDAAYVSELSSLRGACNDRECGCVITRDSVAGLPAPGAPVAERWGEIVHGGGITHR